MVISSFWSNKRIKPERFAVKAGYIVHIQAKREQWSL